MLGKLLRSRPLALAAACLLVVEASAAGLGLDVPALAIALLGVAPGLALVPLLPERARERPAAALAAVPSLGIASTSVLLISMASAGIRLDGASVRLGVAALVIVGLLAVPGPEPRVAPSRYATLAVLGLAGSVLAALLLQDRVIGGEPITGNDWAKYVLYADQVRQHGSLLIDNPHWMLGMPFREDPGAPALYGAYLSLTGRPADDVAHGIGLFALVQILSVFAFVRAWWGGLAAVLGAALWATLPLNYTILGWHGLANTLALALLPTLFVYLTALVADRLDRRAAVGFGLLLVALAGAHRLSFAVGLAIVVTTILVTLPFARRRGRVLSGGAATLAAAALLSPGVAYDLISRGRTFGGTQGYQAYLTAKVEPDLLLRDLTVPFAAATTIALVAALLWSRRTATLRPLLAGLAVVALLAFSWIAHVALHYERMTYFLPLVAVPLTAIAAVRLLGNRGGALAGLALTLVIAANSWAQNEDVRRFYQFADQSALRGIKAVSSRLSPQEVVVTDGCWCFLATWLLKTPTLAALEPENIQPKAELRFARRAKAILSGTPEGRADARRLGVRWLLVDPMCSGRTEAPGAGRAAFASERLRVLRGP